MPESVVVVPSLQFASVAAGPVPTGVARLDSLLAGGWPSGSSTLLLGPAFSGREVLLARAVVAAALSGRSCTFVLLSHSARDMSRRLCALEPAFADAERAGLVAYVDLYTHVLGGDEPHPQSVQLRPGTDVLELVSRWTHPAGPGLMAVESASMLLLDLGAARGFGILRRLVGRGTKDGGVALIAMEAGLNSEAEAQMVKHLCTGMVEFRRKDDLFALRTEGHETAFPRAGWVAYEFTPQAFRITGSFAVQGIR